MAANNGNETKVKGHIDARAVVSFFCTVCGQEIGKPEEGKLEKVGDKIVIDPEDIECPLCDAPVSHKKIVIAELA